MFGPVVLEIFCENFISKISSFHMKHVVSVKTEDQDILPQFVFDCHAMQK